MKKISFLLFLMTASIFFLSGCRDKDVLLTNQQVDYEEDVKPLIAEKTNPYKSRGSCNAIVKGSRCIDYVGSLWTEEQMKLNCQGDGTVFSLDACPYTEVGGCRATPGTITETIAWAYNYGGDPVDGENAIYAEKACNAIGAAEWAKPQF